MAELSSIEWTDHTFNPWWGCTKVSPGCKNCYADKVRSLPNDLMIREFPNGKQIWPEVKE